MPVKRRPPNRARRSIPAFVPAPVGGLNGRDSYAAMPISDAFLMDNWFPRNTTVDTRGGSVDYVQNINAPVESLEVYTGGAGSVMLAFAGGNIFDVSADSDVTPPLLRSGQNSSRITSAMFSNAGNQFLLVFSGLDQPLAFDGAAFTPLAYTGITGAPETLYGPHAFKGRVFIAQKDKLGFYYLDVGAIQGPAHFFDLSQVSLKGGSLVCITSFSNDGTGVGPEDYALFVTSEGEYILYNGTDPSNSANWALVGRYLGPVPIGHKGYFRFRSDVYFITREGVMSFSQIRQTGEGVAEDTYITSKLGVHYKDLTTYSFVHGWGGFIYPTGSMLIVNIPTTGSISGEYCQFAMNTDTNAWGRFIHLPSICWALFNRIPYFGTFDGRVVEFDAGATDNGKEVRAVARQAWSTFETETGIGVVDKQFHMASIILKADGQPNVSCNINVNFEDDQPAQVANLAENPGASWNIAAWNAEYWAGTSKAHTITLGFGKIGYVGSLWLEASSPVSRVQWVASRILTEHTNRGFI